MRQLACRLRANQLYYHNAHNLVDGENFFSDHEFFAEAYKAHEVAYDLIIERMVGMGKAEELDFRSFHHEVATKLEEAPAVGASPETYFVYALKIELGTIQMIEAYIRSGEYTVGTENMLAGLADEGEKRIYKIQARLQNEE